MHCLCLKADECGFRDEADSRVALGNLAPEVAMKWSPPLALCEIPTDSNAESVALYAPRAAAYPPGPSVVRVLAIRSVLIALYSLPRARDAFLWIRSCV